MGYTDPGMYLGAGSDRFGTRTGAAGTAGAAVLPVRGRSSRQG